MTVLTIIIKRTLASISDWPRVRYEMVISAVLRADVALNIPAVRFGAGHFVAARFLDKGRLA